MDLLIDIAASSRVTAEKTTRLERDFSDMKHQNALFFDQLNEQNRLFQEEVKRRLDDQDRHIKAKDARIDNLYRVFYLCTGAGVTILAIISAISRAGMPVVKAVLKLFEVPT